jgi:CRAL/TRIO domain
MERLIERDLNSQTMVIRGHDKLNRPIILRFPRQRVWSVDSDASSQEDEDSFYWAQLYIAERAIAVAEIRSRGQSELLAVFFGFGSYDSKNAPPVGVMIRTVTGLQANYPERLGKAVVMDVPFWINALISVVQPFLSVKTREKLVVLGSSSLMPGSLWRPFSSSVDSVTTRDAVLRELVDADQAMPRFRDDGNLKSDIVIDHFLHHIPFYELYDFGDTATSIIEF